ncbi:hypothetical protein ACOSP7_015941 [Xanthoceras sorbifolium]
MTRNITLLIALTWFLVVASFIMCTNATGRAHSQTIDDTVYPQGCRCCWFIWKPMIRCGQTCCGDGCTCT